jgi:nucleoside-diphosphate-sugar epimerase
MAAQDRLHVVFGTGQVGRALAAHLTRLGLPVRAVSRHQPPALDGGAEWWPADVTDPEAANSTRYGLSAGLITSDNQRGFALARRIDAGVVHVNNQTIADEPQLPLGGVKDSGWGRSGPASMADFTEIQWITTRDGTGSYPI